MREKTFAVVWTAVALLWLHARHADLRAQSPLPTPWTATDVGVVRQPGNSESAGEGSFIVTGAGADIWGAEDAFQFMYQPIAGDGAIEVSLSSERITHAYAKAGVMIRQTLDPASAHVILDVKPDGGIEFMTRSSAGDATAFIAGASAGVIDSSDGTASFNVRLKLTRAGGVVTGSISIDGSASWTVVGSAPFVSGRALTGMAVTSHNTSALNRAIYVSPRLTATAAVLTQHNDNGRSGANLAETLLTVQTVQSGRFGLLFSLPVDGQVYAQPLYMPDVSTSSGVRNVLYVATEHNSLYAFDADRADAPLWQVSLGPSVPQDPDNGPDRTTIPDCRNLTPEIGITSTPVIDPEQGMIYALGKTVNADGVIHQRLVAVDVTNGALLRDVDVQASLSVNGHTVVFDPAIQLNRPGLLLTHGLVYAGFGSHCDYGGYHGWILGFDPATLTLVSTYVVTPSGIQGSIWQGAQGLTADDSGAIYALSANGTFDADSANYGNTFLKLMPNGNTLAVVDSFTPYNVEEMNARDGDLGAAGILLIPGTRLLLGGGKEGRLYLVDAGRMGSFDPLGDHVVQSVQVTNVPFWNNIHGAPVYWQSPAGGRLYVWGENEPMKAFGFDGARMTESPVGQGPVWAPPDAMPGGFLSVSANGSVAGSGIVWALVNRDADASNMTVAGVLHAFDAEDVTHELWNSDQNGVDNVGGFAKFCPPTVVNGRVYVATASSAIRVYGLSF